MTRAVVLDTGPLSRFCGPLRNPDLARWLEGLLGSGTVLVIFILALVEVNGGSARGHYVPWPFHREPDFGAASVNYKLAELVSRATEPL